MEPRPDRPPARAHDPSDDVPPGVLKRAIGASAIGNATEWFDYGVYAYATTYITLNLVPDVESNTLITLAGFAISFLVRPFGGMFWGPLGDKIGRKAVLSLTIILMAAATVAIGLIPTFDAIGWWALVLLYLLRMIQGFSAGGEYGGAATFMAEYSPDHKRGFYGSFLEVGTLAGFSAGALSIFVLQQVTDPAFMDTWGWRIPFLLAGPLGIIGLYLRLRVEDTPVFRELESKVEVDEQVTGRLRELFSTALPALLTLTGLVLALNVVNYTLLAYMPTYLGTYVDLDANTILLIPVVGQLVMMLVLPSVGSLSDRVGRKPLWAASLIGLIVFSIPMYLLMAQGFVWAMIAFAVLGLLYTPQLATISSTFPAMFPTHLRYAGVAIGYNVSTALFGGTAPYANEALIEGTGNNLVPAFYMMGACLIGLVALRFLIETKGQSLRGSALPGTEEALEEQRAL